VAPDTAGDEFPDRTGLLDGKMPAPKGEPGKVYSGKFVVRIPAALHKKIALKAQARGESLNQYVAEVLTQT
jgi:predicted HicB family RNase H-like nuclease